MSDSAHIVYVTQVDITGQSGQNLYSRSVASAIADRDNVCLTLICPAPSNRSHGLTDRADVSVKYLPEKKAGSMSWHITVQAPTAKALLETHQEKNIDSIVTPLKTSNIVPPVFSTIFNIPMALLVEGMLTKNINKKQPFRGATTLSHVISLINATSSQHIFAAYRDIEEWIQAYPTIDDKSVTVFHHGVDTSAFRPVSKSLARRRLPVDNLDCELVIGFVGSFKPYHSLETLIDSVNILSEDLSVHLLLIGDGPKRDDIEKKVSNLDISEITTFTGFVEHKKVHMYISACDILYGVIDPDHWGHPMKVYEYLACGRPVVAYNNPELDFIEEKNIGITIDQVSDDTVAGAFREISRNINEENMNVKSIARQYILENHSWDAYAKAIIRQIS